MSSQNELMFTLVNCDGLEIRKEYGTVEEFKNEMRSDKVDIPMLNDIIKDVVLRGVEFKNTWDISSMLDYLR